MKTFTAATILAACGLFQSVAAHMEMIDPPPFRSKHNTNAGSDVDYSMTAPLSPSDASQYPCKGYHKLVGTPAGASVASWGAGSTQSMTISGGAAHNGGSCQASLSYDQGETFTVIHSYIGNCPVNGESSYQFTVPSDAPAGDVLFAWTWFNTVGNREMYMNCAAVTITGGSSKVKRQGGSFSSRPSIFVANVPQANGCQTIEGKPVLFPSPGDEVDTNTSDTSSPGSDCPAGSAPAPAPPSTPKEPTNQDEEAEAPVATTPADEPTPTSTKAAAVTSKAPAAQTTIPGAVFIPSPTTTLQTSARTTASVETGFPAEPQPTGTTPPTDAPGAVTAGTACDNEGYWNCVDGVAFQRCASGQWSSMIQIASGTECSPGQADTIVISKRGIRGSKWF